MFSQCENIFLYPYSMTADSLFISIDKCLDCALTYSYRYCLAFQCDGSLISLCELIPPQ